MKKIALLFLLAILVFNTKSQNLISNPSFENLNTYGNLADWKCLGVWCNAGSGNWFTAKEFASGCMGLKKNDYAHPNCTQFGAAEHRNTLSFACLPRCSDDPNTSDNLACTTYANQKLNKPLEIGEIYKISYWVFISSVFSEKDPAHEANKHLGILLTNKQVPFQHNTTNIIEKDVLKPTNDTIILDKWVKKEIIMIPTCELNYFTIGVFKEKDWAVNLHADLKWFHYFIDNISIEKVQFTPTQAGKATYYCNETEKEAPYNIPSNLDINIQFDYNSDNIKNTLQLDTFAQDAQKNKNQIYYLSGHSDKTGINKLEISKKRLESVIKYIQERYKIPKYRLITGYFGDKYATSNDKQSRKVHIMASIIPKDRACYREALRQIDANNYDLAANMLNCWVAGEYHDDKILIYFDPQVEVMRKHNGWKFIDATIHKSYKRFNNPTYAFLLDSLYIEDQKYRKLATYVQDLAGYNAEIDTTTWEYPSINIKQLNKQDSLIYLQMITLIDKYGYPKQSEVGKRSAKSATIILIHSHNIPAIKKYLPILEAYCRDGEGDWSLYSMLYDKLCTLEEKVPQRYATQFVGDTKDDKVLTLYRYESKEAVNEARRKIALPPLNDEYFAMKIQKNEIFQGVK